MFRPSGGRGGPSQRTSASVQCQKCLKRDEYCVITTSDGAQLTVLERHYSYECKANPQERPYVARPSRSQQFFNPKLKPKLTEDTPDALQKKQGVADEELAKKEAERAKKRELEEREELALRDSPPQRKRSTSYDSVATISTRSRSPPPRRGARSGDPVEAPRDISTRRRSFDSRSDYSSGRSESPDRGHERREPARRSPSPRREEPASYSMPSNERPARGDRRHGRTRREPSRSLSRSPSRSPVREDRRQHRNDRRYRERDDRGRPSERRGPLKQERSPEPPRERSLSPFSKRLALTQSMNR